MTFRQIRNAMVLAGLAVVSISAPAWALENEGITLPGPGGIAIGGLIALGVGAAIRRGDYWRPRYRQVVAPEIGSRPWARLLLATGPGPFTGD